MSRSNLSLAVNAFLILLGAQLSLIEAHSNTVAVAGSEVIMKCQTSSENCNGVHWMKRTTQVEVRISRNNQIYRPYVDRFSVDNSSGCNLVIKNVSLTDAGRFTCDYVQNSYTMAEASLLIVLESLPKCSVRVNASSEGIAAEGDEVEFICDVKFNATEGEGASVTWKSLDNVSVSVKSNTDGRLLHSIVAKRPGIPSFECITTFNIPKDIAILATNIPTAPPCVTQPIEVLYQVTNVTLAPSLSYYSLGSIITCYSDGNPPATYRWEIRRILEVEGSCGIWSDVSGERGETFRTAENNETNGWYRCSASNTIRGRSFLASSPSFQVIDVGHNFATTCGEDIRSEETSNSVFAIAFFIGVLFSLLIFCVVLFILTKMRYVHFHRPTAQTADEGKHDYVNMGRATTHPSPVEAVTSATKNEGDETAYASLGEERNAQQHSYASLAEIRK